MMMIGKVQKAAREAYIPRDQHRDDGIALSPGAWAKYLGELYLSLADRFPKEGPDAIWHAIEQCRAAANRERSAA